MNQENLKRQQYVSQEEIIVSKIEDSVFTMTITNANEAFKFFKEELVSLSKKYPDTFSVKNTGNDGLLFGFLAEEKRYEAYGTDNVIYIDFYKKGSDKRFEIRVGRLFSVYKFDRLDSSYGYKLVEEESGKDDFNLAGVPVNKLLITTLLDKLSEPIDSLIFGAAE